MIGSQGRTTKVFLSNNISSNMHRLPSPPRLLSTSDVNRRFTCFATRLNTHMRFNCKDKPIPQLLQRPQNTQRNSFVCRRGKRGEHFRGNLLPLVLDFFKAKTKKIAPSSASLARPAAAVAGEAAARAAALLAVVALGLDRSFDFVGPPFVSRQTYLPNGSLNSWIFGVGEKMDKRLRGDCRIFFLGAWELESRVPEVLCTQKVNDHQKGMALLCKWRVSLTKAFAYLFCPGNRNQTVHCQITMGTLCQGR